MYKSILSLALLFVSFTLTAQLETDTDPDNTLTTDRPTESISPYNLGKGMLQIESGYLRTTGFTAIPQLDGTVVFLDDVKNVTFNSTLLRYGLSDKLELRIQQGIGKTRTENINTLTQLDATHISVKIKLGKNLALLPYFEGPMFTNLETDIEAGFRFAMQSKLSEKMNLTYNLGANFQFRENTDDVILSPLTTLALGYQISPKLQSFVEYYGFIPLQEGYDADLRMGFGFMYLVNDHLQLDISGGFGLTEYSQKTMIGLGASFRLDTK